MEVAQTLSTPITAVTPGRPWWDGSHPN